MKPKLRNSQNRCHAIKLIWRRDLQREQTTPRWPNLYLLFIYDLLPPSPRPSHSSPPKARMSICHMCYILWMFIFFLSCLVSFYRSLRLVNWSPFHSSHLYYEHLCRIVLFCWRVCPSLVVCNNLQPGATVRSVFHVLHTIPGGKQVHFHNVLNPLRFL